MFPIDSQSSHGQDDDWLSPRLADSQMQDCLTAKARTRFTWPRNPSFASSNGTRDTSNRRSRSNHIRYDVEWKVTLNRRSKAEDTGEDVVLSPRELWESSLRRKLENVVKKKLPANRSFQVEDIRMVESVTGKRKLKKRYDGLDINWATLEKQLRSWSYLLARRKQLCITISFNYTETTPEAGPSQQTTRPGGRIEMDRRPT
ncbi:uncharacterized protein PG998_014718 [Apiospora kogelbergensis]|uniref:uncharacterized protein n=1 Tax=Apiospora kogelbergensis TaxID=1337665 RepID=UPI0031304D47